MQLEQIRIEKLFGKFDYTIDLNTEAGITILTGPNGYGKTTILRVLWGLFQGGDICVGLYASIICRFTDGRSRECITYKYDGPIKYDRAKIYDGTIKRDSFGGTISAYLIKDQRLEQIDESKNQNTQKERSKFKIGECSSNLRRMISEIQAIERQKSDELNATYAERLFEYKTALPSDIFETRFLVLRHKYRQLMEYGIYVNELKEMPYEGENQRALSIFLEDWEKKVALYDGLVERINFFVYC